MCNSCSDSPLGKNSFLASAMTSAFLAVMATRMFLEPPPLLVRTCVWWPLLLITFRHPTETVLDDLDAFLLPMFLGLLLTLLPDLSSPDDRSSSFSRFFSFCLSCCSSRNFLLLPEPLGCLELRRFCSLQNCLTAILSPSNGRYVPSTLSSMQGITVTSICTFEQQNTVVINEIMHCAQNSSLLES